jgi:hypothetical protein
LYKTVNDLYRIVWSSSRLKRAILYDSFRVGLIPSTVLQRIHIDCKLDNYRTRRTCDGTRPNWRCKHTAAEAKFLRGAELAAKFDTLNHIRNKKGFHLFVALKQHNVRLAILAEAMDALRNVRDGFMKAGADVIITWNYSGHCDSEDDTDGDAGIAWPINDYFNMAPIFWKESMRSNLTMVSTLIRNVTAGLIAI